MLIIIRMMMMMRIMIEDGCYIHVHASKQAKNNFSIYYNYTINKTTIATTPIMFLFFSKNKQKNYNDETINLKWD